MKNLKLFDAHCDTVSAMLNTNSSLQSNKLHVDLSRSEIYTNYAQFFAIFAIINEKVTQPNIQELIWPNGKMAFDSQYDVFIREIEKNKNQISFCRNASEMEEAFSKGKNAAFLSVEGAEILDCSIGRLEEAYVKGVRSVVLTWNFENKLSGTNDEASDKGLTEYGRQFVKRCHELGIMVDVSHLSEPGFWDVIEVSDRPIIASHSNSKALWGHKRNLTDEQFKAICKCGGVAGINLYSDFLGEDPDIDTVTAHIEHFLDLGGAAHIAIGADLDGCDKLPKGINGVENIYKIAESLLKKNYTESLIYDIFYNNLKRVVMEICDI